FICSQTCGFVHSILVTVPVNSTGFFASNSAAKAWWADTDTAVPPRHNAIPEITTTSFSVMAVNLSVPSTSVPFVQFVARRNFAGDIYAHRLAFPVLDELLFSKTPVHEFFRKLDARIIEHGRVRFQPSIERHRNRPGLGERLRIVDRHFVANRIGRDRRIP